MLAYYWKMELRPHFVSYYLPTHIQGGTVDFLHVQGAVLSEPTRQDFYQHSIDVNNRVESDHRSTAYPFVNMEILLRAFCESLLEEHRKACMCDSGKWTSIASLNGCSKRYAVRLQPFCRHERAHSPINVLKASLPLERTACSLTDTKDNERLEVGVPHQ